MNAKAKVFKKRVVTNYILFFFLHKTRWGRIVSRVLEFYCGQNLKTFISILPKNAQVLSELEWRKFSKYILHYSTISLNCTGIYE